MTDGDFFARERELARLDGFLGQALQSIGAWEEALSTVEQGLALAIEIGAPHSADLYRLKGELLNDLQPLAPGQAETCFRTAVSTARQHGARLLDLRATVRLARLWRAQGRRQEARDVLAEVYSWFTEGLDTPDLQETRTLLDELAQALPPQGQSSLGRQAARKVQKPHPRGIEGVKDGERSF